MNNDKILNEYLIGSYNILLCEKDRSIGARFKLTTYESVGYHIQITSWFII